MHDDKLNDQHENARSPNEAPEGTGGPEGQDEPKGMSRRMAAWLGMGGVLLALILLTLAPGPGDPADPLAGILSSGDPDDAVAAGTMAPLHFTLRDMNGDEVRLDSFKGKVILVNFWATWCGPCRVEIPYLVALQEEYADDVVILGISVDDPVEKLQPWAAEYNMNYPVLVGNGRQDVQDAFGPLWGIPVTVFVARDGTIHKKHSGIATKEQLEREIIALL